MNVVGFEYVVVDFVGICDRLDDVGINMVFVGKRFEMFLDVNMWIDFEICFSIFISFICIDLFFYFDLVGVVVDFECDIGGLGGDVVNLVNEGDLGDFGVVDFEVVVCEGFFGINDLFDGDRMEGFVFEGFVVVVVLVFLLGVCEEVVRIVVVLGVVVGFCVFIVCSWCYCWMLVGEVGVLWGGWGGRDLYMMGVVVLWIVKMGLCEGGRCVLVCLGLMDW